MKKLILLIIFLGSLTAYGQWGDEEMDQKPSIKDRIFTGGGFGLSFSSNYDFFSLSPIIGYRVTQRLATGVNIIYRHTTYKFVTPKISTNDWGLSPFVRYQVHGPIFLHAEYEYLNNQYVTYSSQSVRKSFNSIMAGGGIFQPIGRRAGFFAIALYNFSYRNPTSAADYYPYSSPIVLRAGVTAGF
ncbi:MAG: hypothetical protein JNM78_00145 [Cyclobacteriaceae bacterium]|nr:hypothetical protein [Cyclobacteriaceae bacterium]